MSPIYNDVDVNIPELLTSTEAWETIWSCSCLVASGKVNTFPCSWGSNKQPRNKHDCLALSHGRYLIKHTAVVITTPSEIAAETASSDYQIDVVGLFGWLQHAWSSRGPPMHQHLQCLYCILQSMHHASFVHMLGPVFCTFWPASISH